MGLGAIGIKEAIMDAGNDIRAARLELERATHNYHVACSIHASHAKREPYRLHMERARKALRMVGK